MSDAIDRAARAEAERKGRDEYWCGDPDVFAAGAEWAVAHLRAHDDTTEQAAKVIAEDAWQRSQQWEIPPGKRSDAVEAWAECAARALAAAGLLAPDPLEGVEDISAAQEWVMIPADQVHDEWAVERPDPVDHQPRYDRFPTLDAALAERWGNDRAVHRVATAWEPVDTDAAALEGREDL